MFQVDLNSDMGESFGAYKLGGDEQIIKSVSSANVACGFHAGDPMVMAKTVQMAKENGVSVGAHPGYPDLMGFGRRKMVLSAAEVKNYMKYQIGALNAFVTSAGMKLQHVAPHGALGNLCQYDREVSRAIVEAVYEIDPELIMSRSGRRGSEDRPSGEGGDLCGPCVHGRPVTGSPQGRGIHDHG